MTCLSKKTDTIEPYVVSELLSDKPVLVSCGNDIFLPLETNWQEVYKSIVMFFELNFGELITNWAIDTVRQEQGVVLDISYEVSVRAPYIVEKIDKTIKDIVINHGMDTTTRISGTKGNFRN